MAEVNKSCNPTKRRGRKTLLAAEVTETGRCEEVGDITESIREGDKLGELAPEAAALNARGDRGPRL